MLPSVTCSGRKLRSRAGSILKPAHCSLVGLKVGAADGDCCLGPISNCLSAVGQTAITTAETSTAAATDISCANGVRRRKRNGTRSLPTLQTSHEQRTDTPFGACYAMFEPLTITNAKSLPC